jgi:hypothetical protein
MFRVIPETRVLNLTLYLLNPSLFARQVKVNPSNLLVALGKHLVYFLIHLTIPLYHLLSRKIFGSRIGSKDL